MPYWKTTLSIVIAGALVAAVIHNHSGALRKANAAAAPARPVAAETLPVVAVEAYTDATHGWGPVRITDW